MSWFSDFAKSALSEAQKRIDKVLDIEDDAGNTLKSDPSYKLSDSKLESFSAADNLKSNTSHKLSYTPATSQSPKLSLGTSQTKKRGKPMKLGSSLSRKSSEGKVAVRIGNINKNSSVTNTSVFEEISLEDSNKASQLSSPGKNSSFEVVQPSNTSLHEVQNSNSNKDERICSTDSLTEKNQNILPSGNYSDTTTDQMQTSASEKSFSSSPIHPQLTNNFDSPTVATDSQSPCGSTTASSEIEILDHESSVSEASAVFKSLEYEASRTSRTNSVTTDPYGNRGSPDHVESEASDFGRISGYCSSPLSVGSNDGTSSLMPQTKLANLVEDHSDVHVDRKEEMKLDKCHDKDETLTESVETVVKLSEESMDKVLSIQSDSQATICDDSTLICESSASPSPDNDSLISSVPADHSNSRNEDLLPPALVENETIEIIEKIAAVEREMPKFEDNAEQSVNLSVNDKVVNLPRNDEVFQNSEIAENNSQTSEKFEVYEQQLLTLSLSNAKLNEENDNLRSEIRNLKLEQDHNFDEQQDNLLKTVENLSSKLQELELDKSEISNQLLAAQADLSARLSNEQVQQLIAEKEESIQGLLQEGEVLSKQHLQLNNTIKKLRSKLSDRDSSVKDLTEKIDKVKDENKSLKSRLTEVQGQSSEDRGAAKRLSEAYQERETELNAMKNRLEEAEEKKRAAQATLDSAYKDLAELNKKLAALQSDREAEIRDNELVVTKRMQQEAEKLQQEHEHQMHMRMLQLGELQDAIERNEAVNARKEDQLRKDIKDLQQRLHESEMRNHELSETISESTRPILRQMENLQSTYSTRAKTWEALEKSLTSRLGDCQVQLVASQEKERSLQMQLVDYKSRVTTMEQQLNEARSEKIAIRSEVETLRSDAEKYDEKLQRIRKELETSQKECEELKSKARRDRLTLENQLDMEKVRSEVEKKKSAAQIETLQKEKERLLWINRNDSVVSSASALNTDAESVASSGDTFNNLDVFERQVSNSGMSAYDSVRAGSNNSALMENLQSQLKMRDGEIAQLQGEINTLERTRSSMAEEIVRLTNENEDLGEIAKDVEDLKRRLKDMEGRHDAVLTMYGEKAEEAEELRLDLEDVKTMYRNQIDTLLKSQ